MLHTMKKYLHFSRFLVLLVGLLTLSANQAWGAEEALSQTLTYDTWTYSGSTTNKSSYRLFHSGSYIESAEFDLSTLSKVVVYGGTFGGTSYNKLTIGDGTKTWKSVTVSGSSQTGVNTYTDGTTLSGTGKLRITSNSGTASSNGVRISKVEIYTTGGVTYTDNFLQQAGTHTTPTCRGKRSRYVPPAHPNKSHLHLHETPINSLQDNALMVLYTGF